MRSLARTSSRENGGSPRLGLGGAVGVATAQVPKWVFGPGTLLSRLQCPSHIFTTLFLHFKIQNLELELIVQVINLAVCPGETLDVPLMIRNGIVRNIFNFIKVVPKKVLCFISALLFS